jgi:hypothetical protein
MKKLLRLIGHASAVVAFLPTLSTADVLITGRSSLMSTSIEFGYIGSVSTSMDSEVSTLIDDSPLMSQGSATDGGAIGDVSWDASYEYRLDQEFVPNSPQGFSGSSSTNLFAFAGGDGISRLSSTNRLEIIFENSQPASFGLLFNGTDFSSLSFDRMTIPGTWDNVYAISSGFGEVSTILELAAGIFRLTAETNVNTDNGFVGAGSWAFAIVAVPEPAGSSFAVVGCGILMTYRRRQ